VVLTDTEGFQTPRPTILRSSPPLIALALRLLLLLSTLLPLLFRWSIFSSAVPAHVDGGTRASGLDRHGGFPKGSGSPLATGYQLLSEDSHVFLGYGSISKVKEFDGDGNVVFSAQFGDDM
jgi:hypothetical protein